VLADLCGYKWELRGVRRVLQVKHAKPHGQTGVRAPRTVGDTVKIGYSLTAKRVLLRFMWPVESNTVTEIVG